MGTAETMDLINNPTRALTPSKKNAPIATGEDFAMLGNGVNADKDLGATDMSRIGDTSRISMPQLDIEDEKISSTRSLTSSAPEGYESLRARGWPGVDDVDGAGARGDRNDSDIEEDKPDDKADFNNVKHLTQGMMDAALLSANANQLRTVLESNRTHPFYMFNIVLISASLICQVGVGIALILDYQYHVTNQLDKARSVSRVSMFGIFLIIVINVFIAAFSVATPMTVTTTAVTTT